MPNVTIEGRVMAVAQRGEFQEAIVLTPDGDKERIATKDLRTWGVLAPGMLIKANCAESIRPNPKGGEYRNLYINGWTETGPAAPVNEAAKAIAEEARINSGEDNPWPGKDRAIAMESAYHSAAAFFQGRRTFVGTDGNTYPYVSDHLHALALEIYANIERARAGTVDTGVAE